MEGSVLRIRSRRLPTWVERVARVGVRPSDADDVRVRKEVLTLSAALMASLAFIWVIGIDTGPVVAGVIGRSKFTYDLWGDTVNTASRMQSHAPRGAIQVTERVRTRLAESYSLEPRGEIQVKGMGGMSPYLLIERRTDQPDTATMPSADGSTSATGAGTENLQEH